MPENMSNYVTVSLRNVCFSYGKRSVFRDFSLDMTDLAGGGVIAISGPSGCGKSTLLRLLAGLEQAESGEVICPPSERLALLFQEDRLLRGLPAAAQVGAVLPKGAEVLSYLAAVELAEEANTLPEELSGGMRRRLSLARALAYGQDKELLLLDEPFAGVDYTRAVRIMENIRKMQKPLIYTAHSAEVLALADKVIKLGD